MMTCAEYIEKKEAIKAQLEELDNQIIAESGVKVGDIGNLGSPDGEEVQIVKVEVKQPFKSDEEMKVCVPSVLEKTKKGEWSKKTTTPWGGVYVNGKKFNWM